MCASASQIDEDKMVQEKKLSVRDVLFLDRLIVKTAKAYINTCIKAYGKAKRLQMLLHWSPIILCSLCEEDGSFLLLG